MIAHILAIEDHKIGPGYKAVIYERNGLPSTDKEVASCIHRHRFMRGAMKCAKRMRKNLRKTS